MRWFIPSHGGDVRFERISDTKCSLVTADLTVLEHEVITRWAKDALKKEWLSGRTQGDLAKLKPGESLSTTIDAPFADAAGTMASLLKFNARGTLTAFKFSDGRIIATDEVDNTELPRWAKKLLMAPTPQPQLTGAMTVEAGAARVETPAPTPPRPAPTPAPRPVAAATVTRPSMSCPECLGRPEKDRMACDVLWEFLDDSQKEEWLRDRGVTVIGNRTGHTYRVHARDTVAAKIYGRCTFDLDDHVILHNYNRMVPPEEEVLGLVLMLQLCEEWIRVAGEVDPIRRASKGTVFENTLGGVDYVHDTLGTLAAAWGLAPQRAGLGWGARQREHERAVRAALDPLDAAFDPRVGRLLRRQQADNRDFAMEWAQQSAQAKGLGLPAGSIIHVSAIPAWA